MIWVNTASRWKSRNSASCALERSGSIAILYIRIKNCHKTVRKTNWGKGHEGMEDAAAELNQDPECGRSSQAGNATRSGFKGQVKRRFSPFQTSTTRGARLNLSPAIPSPSCNLHVRQKRQQGQSSHIPVILRGAHVAAVVGSSVLFDLKKVQSCPKWDPSNYF